MTLELIMTTASDLLETEFIKAEIDDRLSNVLGKLKSEAFVEVFVFRGNKLKGIFSPVFATRSKLDVINTKVDKFIRPATCIEEETPLDEIVRKMIDSDYNALPVKSNGKIIGVVHIFNLLNSILGEFTKITIRDINLNRSFRVKENDRIGKAIQILHDNSLCALAVIDEKNNPTGVISHFDIMRNIHLYSHERDFGQKHDTVSKAFKAESDNLDALSVYNFIRYKDNVSVISDDNITKAINIMMEKKILNLLVKDAISIVRAKNILKNYHEITMREHKATTELIGLKDLSIDSFTKSHIKDVAQRYAGKFSEHLQNNVRLKVHIKQYKAAQADKEHKYSVKVHLIFPGDTISVDKSADWDIKVAVQKAMEDMENRIQNIFHD